jgi:multiple sugar transport system permease protein
MMSEKSFATYLITPSIIVLLLTTTFPILYLIWSSFQNINLAMPWMDGFVGFKNYTEMFQDKQFWKSFRLTITYTASTVILQLIIGLGLALLVLKIPRAQWVFRLMAILPIVLAPVVVGLFWRTLMLAPDFGIIDFFTKTIGLGSFAWLSEPRLAVISVILIHTWQWTPFAFLVLLASLASLPTDLYEAAKIDKAPAYKRFFYITLPLIRPAIIIIIIIRSMVALSAYAAIYAATRGGPGTATEILNLYAYRTSFLEVNFGYGSTLAVFILLITITVAGILYSIRKKRS